MPNTTRPVFHAGIGAKLVRARQAKNWDSQSGAAQIAVVQKKLWLLKLSTLRALEEGRIKNPDPDLLRQVATLYDMDYAELARDFFEANYGVTGERSVEEVALALTRERERTAWDDDEYSWLVKWRGLAPQGRKLAVKQVDLLLEEFAAAGARPPQKAARRKAAS
ncbi:helix-turn-helix domain-containing protein [Luteitalea sp.]